MVKFKMVLKIILALVRISYILIRLRIIERAKSTKNVIIACVNGYVVKQWYSRIADEMMKTRYGGLYWWSRR